MRSPSIGVLLLFVAATTTSLQLDGKSPNEQPAASFNHGRFEFSANAVPDPSLRDQLSTLVTKLVLRGDSLDDADRHLLSTRGDVVVHAIRVVWPSLSGLHLLDSDGALQYEKYNLLDALPEEPIYAELLRDVLRAEHISSGMTHVLLGKRHEQALASELLRQLDWSKAHADFDGSIYCVAVLLAWKEKIADTSLDELSKMQLSPPQRKAIELLKQRGASGERIRFKDVEELEFSSGRPD